MERMRQEHGYWQNESRSSQGWHNEEENPVISPAILNLSWTKETIDKWNSDRRRKYPTLQKGEKAARVKQILDEKRQKLHEIRLKQLQERKERPQFRNIHQKRRGGGGGRRRHQNKARRYGVYEFPDIDYEDEKTDIKDGIYAFCGTKSNENSCRYNEITKPNEDLFSISDEDDDMNQQMINTDMNEESSDEDDDDPPEVVPIKRGVQEQIAPTNEPFIQNVAETTGVREESNKKNVQFQDSTGIAKNSPTKSISRDGRTKDYVKILRGRRHEQTFLEKLLEDEILKERYEILQCLHYVCSNNFFDIGKTIIKD